MTNPQLQAGIDNLAELAVRVGVNVQPGQTVFIGGGNPTNIHAAPFVRRLAAKAYDAGARYVHVLWEDLELVRLTMERADLSAVGEYPAHLARWFAEAAEQDAAFIHVRSSDPGLLKDVEPQRLVAAQRAKSQALAPYRHYTQGMLVSWVIVGHPNPGWARTVFPDLPAAEAEETLWWRILEASRALGSDPVGDWHAHLARLDERVQWLNAQRFRRLHYRAPGTDLQVGLPDGHVWLSAGSARNRQGTPFVPNIPTEEFFTAPARDDVHGTVRSTMPLNYNGVLVRDLTLRLEGGQVVDFGATTGLEVVKGLLDTDKGARRFGEVALVPADSPLSRMNTLFYDTLFDENIACHFALGNAYPATLENGTQLDRAELKARGLNYSLTHVDFMVGSSELDVDGETANGERVPVLRRGLWAAN